ncbi:hypothetical protein H0H81_003436 [Sphagnurus paluster]|uniref:Leucine carboxyl methyltransferase 1 n=1 Tax=Sphagnurus paluster TaxID=117069 RepID=A0A9P7K7F2_9AGAR|nr:hypothetical protein H0H81_003436 [Sphagnurus paluster]
MSTRSTHIAPDADASIRETDNDAAVARLSAAQKGYLHDPYIRHLVPRAHLQQPRPPLINVGTYVRGAAIDALVEQWLQIADKKTKKCQIVSLGAGSDTRFWRIANGTHKDTLATYVEVDFPEVTTRKAMSIRKSKELGAILGGDIQGGTALHAGKYHLLPGDLRMGPTALSTLLTGILDSSLPTLLLFECVLVYMVPSASDAVLRWFVDYFSDAKTPLGAVVYEMFNLEDAFGKVMVSNLKSRNVSIPGAEPYRNLEALSQRFLSTGFNTAHSETLREIRRTWIAPDELERLSMLEMLDEIEELELVLEHYAVSWGLAASGADASWGGWGLGKK